MEDIMQVTAECIPCYLQTCLNAFNKSGFPKEQQTNILNQLLPMIPQFDQTRSPAENSTLVLHRLVELMGGQDPFLKAKKESNQQAMSMYDKMKDLINNSEDPLFTALKLAVAGNIIDFGIYLDYDLDKAVKDALENPFAIEDYQPFKDYLSKAKNILVVGDNSGEIVFDRLLIEELKKYPVTIKYGVKGNFILNDATMDDAKEVGMTEVVEVINSGCNFLGTIEEKCSPEFINIFKEADLVISKGQANYESLEGSLFAENKTFFILKAKCPIVAENLNVKYGDIVLAQNHLSIMTHKFNLNIV
jgi:damage-control phosphatase, subfamily I